MTQEMTAKGRAEAAPPPLPPAWFQVPAWLLTLAGLGISVYLTITHYDEGALVCSATSTIDCHAVTTSEYSSLLGIPMPLLGLAFFVGFGALLTPWALRSTWPPLRWGRVAGVSVGVLMVVYLVTVELAVLHKICLWCTGVHAVTVVLFLLVLIDEFRRIGQVD
ncbi:vitamin K epoxide reductase family protein [Actinomadura bangladeshensis]|uniref:Vitamin K epoxide reductase family protein n=1 Tax=Actinomadura bangladeshensis TaxID=453573 RepID=A0A6L9QG91_9ACTN|nr:vitamin K epoxide reductase family protein [Actinomadura bangladeshensis]NEA23693.1 vitamin K epoxide reductase family protein [Actinomadura bangladeshensis]